MSPVLVGTVAGTWVAIGLALSWLMGRRGHNSFGWGVLGAVMGPLAVVLALTSVRSEGRLPDRRLVTMGAQDPGPVAVLVGIDGSPEAAASLQAAVALLGSRLGRLALVTVLDYEAVTATGRPTEAEREARKELERQVARVPGMTPRVELLVGRPAHALVAEALAGGYDLLVIGARGRGRSKALVGSVATRLAADAKVPVLLVGSR